MHRVQIRYKEAARLTLASSVAVGMAIQTLARTIEFVALGEKKRQFPPRWKNVAAAEENGVGASGFI